MTVFALSIRWLKPWSLGSTQSLQFLIKTTSVSRVLHSGLYSLAWSGCRGGHWLQTEPRCVWRTWRRRNLEKRTNSQMQVHTQYTYIVNVFNWVSFKAYSILIKDVELYVTLLESLCSERLSLHSRLPHSGHQTGRQAGRSCRLWLHWWSTKACYLAPHACLCILNTS